MVSCSTVEIAQTTPTIVSIKITLRTTSSPLGPWHSLVGGEGSHQTRWESTLYLSPLSGMLYWWGVSGTGIPSHQTKCESMLYLSPLSGMLQWWGVRGIPSHQGASLWCTYAPWVACSTGGGWGVYPPTRPGASLCYTWAPWVACSTGGGWVVSPPTRPGVSQ